jgi:hypothetical protein
MEMNALLQALVKDLAEQMRPTIAALIDEWMNDSLAEKLAQLNINQRADVDLTDLAQHLTGAQLEVMARHVNLADLAAELGDNCADDIAEHISLADLASEINLPDLASELDLEDSIKSFFSDRSFTISP